MGSFNNAQAKAYAAYRPPQVKLANYHQPEANTLTKASTGDTSTLPVIGKEGHETVELSYSFEENRPFVSSTDPWALKGSTNIREEMLRYSRQVPKFVSSKADRDKPLSQNPLKVAWGNLKQNTNSKTTPPISSEVAAFERTMSEEITVEFTKEEQRREKKEEGRTQKGKLESFFVNIVSSLSGGGFNQQPSFT